MPFYESPWKLFAVSGAGYSGTYDTYAEAKAVLDAHEGKGQIYVAEFVRLNEARTQVVAWTDSNDTRHQNGPYKPLTGEDQANAAFIAACSVMVPRLLETIRQQRELLKDTLDQSQQQVVNLEKQISTCISNYDKTVKLLFATEVERDKAYQVIDESHRMIIDEDTGRRWKELYKEAQKQIVKLKKQRRVGAEAIAELFGIADIINSFPEAPRSDGKEGALGRRVEGIIREQRQQLADERHDHDTTKRLLSEQVNKLWKLQQALEKVAEAKDARDGWKDEHDRAVDQLIDEKRISDRLVDRLSTLEAELTEAKNTITQMREVLEQVQKLKETLRFYGDQHNWPLYLQIDRPLMPIEQDRGAIARRALEEQPCQTKP